jgi:hypothetical protein
MKFTMSNGAPAWASMIAGEVVHTSVAMETSMTASGGGGNNGTGYILPTVVTSNTESYTSIFLKQASGKEDIITIESSKMQVRVGHHLTAVYGAASNKEKGRFHVIYNHDTGICVQTSSTQDFMSDFDVAGFLNKKFLNKSTRNWFVTIVMAGGLWGWVIAENSWKHGEQASHIFYACLGAAMAAIPAFLFASKIASILLMFNSSANKEVALVEKNGLKALMAYATSKQSEVASFPQ